jgi:hypothetical protein
MLFRFPTKSRIDRPSVPSSSPRSSIFSFRRSSKPLKLKSPSPTIPIACTTKAIGRTIDCAMRIETRIASATPISKTI